MENKKKNYTLYADYKGTKVKILSGSLSEIDDFTSYFAYKNAIKKMLLKRNLNNLDIYIESSRGNKYNLVYFNSRPILNYDNNKIIFNRIKAISKEKIDVYLYECCNLQKCLESKNAYNIKIVDIHNKIIFNENYLNKLFNYLNFDYKAYRNFVIYFFKEVNLNEQAKIVPLSEKDKVLSIIEKAKDILTKIDETSDLNDENDYTDDFVSNIMNNDYLDIDEKMTELDILYDSTNENSAKRLK